jgi:hypothetical protein
MDLKEAHKESSNSERTGDKRYHYIFVVPTEWEHGIRDEVFLPIFKAGLIKKDDHICRLLFYTDLDGILYSFQEDNRAQADVLKRNKRYMLYDLHNASSKREELCVRYRFFDIVQTRAKVFATKNKFIMDPDSVCSSKRYSLATLDTIRDNMTKLLEIKVLYYPWLI